MNPGNSDSSEVSGEVAVLDGEARLVYEWVVQHGHLDGDDPARLAHALGLPEDRCRRSIELLVEMCLLTQQPGAAPGRLSAVGPDAAAVRLTGQEEARLRAEEAELHRRKAALARLRAEMASLGPVYMAQSGGTDGAVQILDDMHLVRAALTSVVSGAEEEVLAVQPGGGHPEAALMESLPRDLDMLHRGVRLRSIYQHPTRFHMPTRSYAEVILAAGAEIRTRPEVPGQMVVVDRSVAFVPARLATGGAMLIREPSLVAFLAQTFEHEWGQAIPYDTSPTAARVVSRSIEDAITVLLASGVKDDVIAQRLGMSTRTCRRHIAELLQRIGAQSRFQAGVLAERQGLVTSLGPTPES